MTRVEDVGTSVSETVERPPKLKPERRCEDVDVLVNESGDIDEDLLDVEVVGDAGPKAVLRRRSEWRGWRE